MSKKFSGADGIRGFACLIVLCVHAVAMFYHSTYLALTGMGKVGVWLFFVLSAFLLTSKFDGSGFGFYQVINYALGRFLRIVPIFAIACVIYLFLGNAGINTVDDLKNAVLLRSGYAHLWTIPVEFKFYAILPVIAFLLIFARNKFGYFASVGIAVVMICAQQFVWPYSMTPESSISTHWYLSCFTLGCLCAVCYEQASRLITPAVANVIFFVVLIVISMFSPIARNIIFGSEMDKWTQSQHFSIGAIWCAFMLAMMEGKGLAGRLMTSGFMKIMGRYSFSIYLIHWLIYASISNMHPNSFHWMISAFVAAIAIGALMHHLIEAPIERLRHRIQLGRSAIQSSSA